MFRIPVFFLFALFFVSVVFSTVNRLKKSGQEWLVSCILLICSDLSCSLNMDFVFQRVISTNKASIPSAESTTSIPSVSPIEQSSNTDIVKKQIDSLKKSVQESTGSLFGSADRQQSTQLPSGTDPTIPSSTKSPMTVTTSIPSDSQRKMEEKDFNFNCLEFLSPEYCQGKDPRDEFVFKYRFNKSKKRYLIVVNHHWQFFNGVTFMRSKLYKRFNELYPIDFDLINMGPRFNETYRMVRHSLRVGGEYSYYTLAKAYAFLKGYAEYDGYFLINDDAFLDPHRLQEYDLTQSWHEPTRPYNWTLNWSWNHLQNENGVRYPIAFRNAINEVISNRSLEIRCQLVFPTNQRRSLQDFFYVTASDMPLFLQLVDIFFKHRVFLEQAAPTINWCLSHNEIVNCNHHNWPLVSTCVHLHPIKMGNPFNQNLAMQHIEGTNTLNVPAMSWYCVCNIHN